ncbi:hypothetical protein ACIU1J_30165 [Azospirillum doebereinerae]|uniref:hypothetical protein n=1 Tax=Azospirillum doebereinerae TaxID=92933 RepID=UPI001EE605FE|nr:hypothetical protein [Azospirillum doebereinerae]MCG5240956.1 hypothetical protein [Azospirillum doebereinerae]
MELNEQLINRVVACKHQFGIADENAASQRDATLPAAICNLQDAVEGFLHALAEHFHAPLPDKIDFNRYFDLINDTFKKNPDLSSYELPYKVSLLRMNKMRVNAKHHGIIPEKEDLGRLVTAVRGFFDDVCRDVLKISFSTISLITILKESNTKEMLIEAENLFSSGDYAGCLVSCRKVIYRHFEFRFNIRRYEPGYVPGGLAFFEPCNAPYFTQNAEFIAENVETPFDYIQIDHSALDMMLVKEGIDHDIYWNIWRLTPAVYERDGVWLVKHEYDKLIDDDIKERAEYVLEKTVSIIVAMQQRYKRLQLIGRWSNYILPDRADILKVYKKSDRNSECICMISPEKADVKVSSFGPGLQGDGDYWHVHFEDDEAGVKKYIRGFVHADDIRE